LEPAERRGTFEILVTWEWTPGVTGVRDAVRIGLSSMSRTQQEVLKSASRRHLRTLPPVATAWTRSELEQCCTEGTRRVVQAAHGLAGSMRCRTGFDDRPPRELAGALADRLLALPPELRQLGVTQISQVAMLDVG
jgi:hypothetical protein